MAQPKILICDDDALAVRAVAREARAWGWLPITETSAHALMPLALKHRPEVIVLDVHQAIDGRDLLVALRADPRTSGCRIVLVSGSHSPQLAHDCLELGADTFLTKPFGYSELIDGGRKAQLPVELELIWTPPPTPRCTLLIADDNDLLVSAMVRAARREGFATLTDTTSTQVVELARTHRPGVIVLDVHQAIDGRDLLAQLKRDPETRDIKVVMLSAAEDQVTRHDCFKLGAEEYFTKPLDPTFFRRLSAIAGVALTP